MKITYDSPKNLRNIKERNLAFDAVQYFDFNNAFIYIDQRKNYAETRFIAIGYLDNRLHVLCFTKTEAGIRVISFRKANKREEKRYEKPLTLD